LPRPCLPTAPAVLFQSKNELETKSKGTAIAAIAVGARFPTGTLPCPCLPTAAAVLFQSKNELETKSKGTAIAAIAVGARFPTGTLPWSRY